MRFVTAIMIAGKTDLLVAFDRMSLKVCLLPSSSGQLLKLTLAQYDHMSGHWKSLVEVLTHPRSNFDLSQLRQLSILGSQAEILDAACSVMKAAASSMECFEWESYGQGLSTLYTDLYT